MLKFLFTITIYIVLIWFRLRCLVECNLQPTPFGTIHFYWFVCVCARALQQHRSRLVRSTPPNGDSFLLTFFSILVIAYCVLCIDPFNKIVVSGERYRHRKRHSGGLSNQYCFSLLPLLVLCSDAVAGTVAEASGHRINEKCRNEKSNAHVH